jgi:uncharacterized membrane protein YdjX (TVP38/TMEM64 family)
MAYILAAVLLIPVWPLSIIGGLAFGLWGFVLVPISATLGSVAAFLISRYIAREKIRERLTHQPAVRAVDEVVAEEGWKVIVLLRLSPLVPYNLTNDFCGSMTGVSFAAWSGDPRIRSQRANNGALARLEADLLVSENSRALEVRR